jgi:hypothetical protein
MHQRAAAEAWRVTAVSFEYWSVCPKNDMPAVIDTHETVSQLLTSIDAGRQHANLSSAMRLFVLGHYQPRSTLGRSRVGPSVPSTFNRKSKPAGDSSRKGSLSDTEPAAHDETPTGGSKS